MLCQNLFEPRKIENEIRMSFLFRKKPSSRAAEQPSAFLPGSLSRFVMSFCFSQVSGKVEKLQDLLWASSFVPPFLAWLSTWHQFDLVNPKLEFSFVFCSCAFATLLRFYKEALTEKKWATLQNTNVVEFESEKKIFICSMGYNWEYINFKVATRENKASPKKKKIFEKMLTQLQGLAITKLILKEFIG